MKLSIIIPVFNEEKTIEEVIKAVIAVILPVEKELIVVDDFSQDKTWEILNKLNQEFDFKLVRHEKNKGKGSAIKTGMNCVAGDFILIQDADLEYSPNDYLNLLAPILKDNAEIVYGSRNINKNPRSSLLYFCGGRFISLIFNFLYKAEISDINTGYKIFKRSILDGLDLQEKRFSFCEEVTCKVVRKHYIIKEVPIHYYPRNFKEGKKIRWWRDGPSSIMTMIKYYNYK